MLSRNVEVKKMIFNIATKDDIAQLFNDTDVQFEHIKQQLEKKPDKLEKDAYERLADLEVKMAKLWNLLVETTPRGKEKTTKFGRMFGGQARQLP